MEFRDPQRSYATTTRRRTRAASPAAIDPLVLRLVAERLTSTLRALLAEFPDTARSLGTMAAWLGVSKSSVQRMMEGLEVGLSPVDVLMRMPGPEALRQIVRAVSEHLGAQTTAPSGAAVEEYDRLIRSTSRSRSRFLERIQALDPATSGGAPSIADRRALMLAAQRVCGESLGAKSSIAFVWPDAQRPERLRVGILSAGLEARRRPSARPLAPFLVSRWWTSAGALRKNRSGGGTLDAGPDDSPDDSGHLSTPRVLTRHCSAPLRSVQAGQPSAHNALVLDMPVTPGPDGWLGPVDFAVLFDRSWTKSPLHDPSARLSFAARISSPTRLLVHEVFVHRLIATRAVPVLGVYSLSAPPGDLPGSQPNSDWFERLPDDTPLTRMPMSEVAPCLECPAHTTLARDALAELQIDPRDFLSYRCVVSFPIWQTEYRVNFHVADSEPLR
ncbi:MAG: hypothetical protein SFZ23_16080 [Planctomycetota bacterium]|nr:hypothetical protein [Planctomycetota bacterium]